MGYLQPRLQQDHLFRKKTRHINFLNFSNYYNNDEDNELDCILSVNFDFAIEFELWGILQILISQLVECQHNVLNLLKEDNNSSMI